MDLWQTGGIAAHKLFPPEFWGFWLWSGLHIWAVGKWFSFRVRIFWVRIKGYTFGLRLKVKGYPFGLRLQGGHFGLDLKVKDYLFWFSIQGYPFVLGLRVKNTVP